MFQARVQAGFGQEFRQGFAELLWQSLRLTTYNQKFQKYETYPDIDY